MPVDVESETKIIPGISESRLLGSLSLFRRDRLHLYTLITKTCGDVGRFHLGPFPVYLVNSSSLASQILLDSSTNFDKGMIVRHILRPFLGNGLVMSEGDFHRQQRRLVAPSFQPRHVALYADAIHNLGEQMQASWPTQPDFDIRREMEGLNRRILNTILFGLEEFSEIDAFENIVSFHETRAGSRGLIFSLAFLSIPTPRNVRIWQSLFGMKRRILALIAARRQTGAVHSDILGMLMAAQDDTGRTLSDQQICYELLNLIVAGNENATQALAWSVYFLATHPALTGKVAAELDRVLHGRTPRYTDLPQLPYTLQFLKEALRVYPPALTISRRVCRPVNLQGYQFRKGDTLFISPYTLHRHPAYYPDPERFDPDRFTAAGEKLLGHHAYLPFGAGPRVCIGNHLMLLQGHLLLAMLAQRWTFTLRSRPDVTPHVTASLGLLALPYDTLVHVEPRQPGRF